MKQDNQSHAGDKRNRVQPNEAVVSGGGQRHRSFGRFLAANVAEVNLVSTELFEQLVDTSFVSSELL